MHDHTTQQKLLATTQPNFVINYCGGSMIELIEEDRALPQY